MKITNPAAILSPESVETEAVMPAGGDDWLNRINLTINNFKDLLRLAKDMKNTDLGGSIMKQSNQAESPGKGPGLADYLNLAIAKGYGDIPVGKLIEEISPFTLKQILGVLKNAGLKQ